MKIEFVNGSSITTIDSAEKGTLSKRGDLIVMRDKYDAYLLDLLTGGIDDLIDTDVLSFEEFCKAEKDKERGE